MGGIGFESVPVRGIPDLYKIHPEVDGAVPKGIEGVR
jgi:hypothetical protein